jgi:hypothetical protein
MDYEQQQKTNEEAFRKGVQIMRPDLYVLMQTLDATGVDFTIVLQLIYALERVATGSKYGNVTAYIENGTCTFVRGEESKKINVPVLKS